VCAEDSSDRPVPDAHARGSMRGHKGSDAVQHTRLPSRGSRVHSPRHPSRMLQVSGSDMYHVNTSKKKSFLHHIYTPPFADHENSYGIRKKARISHPMLNTQPTHPPIP
jgi:hypothetical protein